MTSIIEDISTVTTISTQSLKHLAQVANSCICHAVSESLASMETLTEVDIGIGLLYINVEEDQVRYRFIPSAQLESAVNQTATDGESPLVRKAENTLRQRIERVYKKLL